PRALRRPVGALLGHVQGRALRWADLVLVASRASTGRLGGRATSGLVRSPLGVDLDVFGAARPDPYVRAALAPPGTPLLLYAGRLSAEKRIDLLPRMLAAIGPPAILAVAGAGAGEPRLRRLARRLGVEDRLRLLGHEPDRRRLASLMATADCFVHPNPVEPFGLAPLEALAAGCPVVAPDAAGTREALAGRGAVLVP